jgi:hypothetical protein
MSNSPIIGDYMRAVFVERDLAKAESFFGSEHRLRRRLAGSGRWPLEGARFANSAPGRQRGKWESLFDQFDATLPAFEEQQWKG